MRRKYQYSLFLSLVLMLNAIAACETCQHNDIYKYINISETVPPSFHLDQKCTLYDEFLVLEVQSKKTDLNDYAKDKVIWKISFPEIAPSALAPTTYGQLPRGASQAIPHIGEVPTLHEGITYLAIFRFKGTGDNFEYFSVTNGKTTVLSGDEVIRIVNQTNR